MERSVQFGGEKICYQLERKRVKNLNLRIHRDGKVYVSANPRVPLGMVDRFVISKGDFICRAQKRFQEMEQTAPKPKEYLSGETFYLLGEAVTLQVEKGERDTVSLEGNCLRLCVRDPENLGKRENTLKRFWDAQCQVVFDRIIRETYPVFEGYAIPVPSLRIRDMKTRWGTCLVSKGIITLNKRLLGASRSCITYVVMHEFCHFLHPDHSKRFYGLLTALMPDWKVRKTLLNSGPWAWN